jgi:hypothetical protein
MDCLKDMQLSPAVKLKAFRHLQANPEAKNELIFMYEADGEAGVLAVLEPVQTTNAITVQSNSKAEIYIGCSITRGGRGFTSSDSAKASQSSVSKEWKVRNDQKAYLGDKWFPLFKRVKKSSSSYCFNNIPDGATVINLANAPAKRLFGGNGLSNVAFVAAKAHDGFQAVETSKVSHGQGPSGFLHLQPEVFELAIKEGLIVDGTVASSNNTQQQPVVPSTPAANGNDDLMDQLSGVDIQI